MIWGVYPYFWKDPFIWWWFQNFCYFYPWGNDPIWLLVIFFKRGWFNHQLDRPFTKKSRTVLSSDPRPIRCFLRWRHLGEWWCCLLPCSKRYQGNVFQCDFSGETNFLRFFFSISPGCQASNSFYDRGPPRSYFRRTRKWYPELF